MKPIQWDENCRDLLRAAREISGELGHCEIVCSLHLLLALLTRVRPQSVTSAEPDWSAVLTAMRDFAPPWGDVVVLTPGGQTPRTKRVLVRAIELAAEASEPVNAEHIREALRQCEEKLLGSVLGRLGLARVHEADDAR